MSPKTTTIASFAVQHLQFLNEHSQLTQSLPENITAEKLLTFYRQMSLTHQLDRKAVNMQRTGKMGTYPSARGQEAVSIGMGNTLQAKDVFCPYYRDQGVFLSRGVKISEFLSYWGGDERGSDFSTPQAQHDFPIAVPIASQLLHATGVAYALKYRKQPQAVLTSIGEGGTSKGDFYEALNLAGCWNLPVVFVINNNQWAISVASEHQTHCKTFAQKAIAAGFNGWQVDGNDVIAVYYAVSKAMEKARQGGGPTLIEAKTYRLSDHTTADDASRYVPKNALQQAQKKEPIARLGHYLEAEGLWSRNKEKQLQQQLAKEVDAAVAEYLSLQPAQITDMFDYMYATLPKNLQRQRDEASS